ncbi:hypothetical protein D9613_010586 [Agrocybe pediades]|uniref:Uncharacterized protein n=1 Tax=Agrocybe pediades TaxID=84607 RepID=A0A8H4QFN2_9AGAR|nr:hypothetical protein D9613_010586 [Agrocybe pediades]
MRKTNDAMKALTAAHEKLLRGRKIVVTFAQQAPLDQHGGVIKHRKVMTDAARPTALSMIKTGITSRHEGKTQDKIAILEAKLRQMESSKPQAKSDLPPDGGTSSSSSNSTLPYHPSLPMKPPPQLPSHLLPKSPPSQPTPASKSTLPSLPIGVPNPANTTSSKAAPLDYLKTSITRAAAVTTAPPKSGKTAKLLGVKIKPKDPKTKEKSQP